MPRFVLFVLVTLYMGVASGANVAQAGPARDLSAVSDLRAGSMKKLVFAAPKEVPDVAFSDPAGAEYRLADWRGRWVLVNFWATWCGPCRTEMPTLEALEAALGGERFAVVTIATGGSAVPAIDRFFAEIGVERLPKYLDPKQALARQMGVPALPVSVLLDPEGREVARLMGDADWSDESARALFAALIAEP